MDVIQLIADRKLNISFSKYVVIVLDASREPEVPRQMYIEYHHKPDTNAHLAFVFDTKAAALEAALTNCYNNVVAADGVVITRPK